jgi:hypothetical protein
MLAMPRGVGTQQRYHQAKGRGDGGGSDGHEHRVEQSIQNARQPLKCFLVGDEIACSPGGSAWNGGDAFDGIVFGDQHGPIGERRKDQEKQRRLATP